MRVINVIEIENNVVKDITSFGIYEEQLSSEITDKAEELFIEKITEIGYDDEKEDSSEIIDNGYFEMNNQSVCLTWSYIDD